jgi:ankyrin repeat protein
VKLHLDTIRSQPTKGDVKQALLRLDKGAKGLDRTYEQAMERIKGQGTENWELAKRAMAWIVYSKRPLLTKELQHALAVRPETRATRKLDPSFLPSVRVLLSLCAGLVTIDEGSGIIRLVHFTAQEFFMRNKTFSQAQSFITETCVTYLSFEAFASGFCRTDKEFEERLQLHELYNYAAHNWGHHARKSSALCREIVVFLQCEANAEASSQALMAVKDYPGYSQRVPRKVTGLHLTAYFGVAEVVKALLHKGIEADAKSTYCRTPLSYAAENGHDTVIKLLLDTGKVELNSEDQDYRTPLSYAAENGHSTVIKLLLDTGKVDVNSEDQDYRTPLSYAAENGHSTVIKLLLDTGKVDFNSKDEVSRTLLSYAAENGDKAMFKLLLDTGKVDVNSEDQDYRTPLLYAAKNGHSAITKILLDTKNVNPDSMDDYYNRTPLSYAAERGYEHIIKLLLDTKKANINSTDRNGWTPLFYATVNEHEDIVRLLLDTRKVDVNLEDRYYRTPLSYAAEGGYEDIIKLLLDTKKIDINSEDEFDWTPLIYATKNGHDIVAKLLLDQSTS